MKHSIFSGGGGAAADMARWDPKGVNPEHLPSRRGIIALQNERLVTVF